MGSTVRDSKQTEQPASPRKAAGQTASVHVKGLQKLFGGVRAVNGVDFRVEGGEFVTLLGPSGCGKTTTLRCIAGLESVDGGEIRIGDQIVSGAGKFVAPEFRNIGMVFQSYAVWPHMTVFDNVAYGLVMRKVPRSEFGDRVSSMLKLVGLGGLENRLATQLSGGQQQRVSLARAMVVEPQLLLFDEPLSNLDAKLRERMRVEIRELQQRTGVTAIYVTHDQAEAMAVSDRIILMQGGQIEQEGDAEELYHRPRSRFAANFVGMANFLRGAVEARNGAYTQIRLRPETLIWCIGVPAEIPAGETVSIMFRPEYVEFKTECAGENCWRVAVTQQLFLGEVVETNLTFAGENVLARHRPAYLHGEKERWMHVPPDLVRYVPES